MNKKLLLLYLTIFSSLFLSAQNQQQVQNTCGTLVPPQQWDDWLNEKVEEYKKEHMGDKTQAASVKQIPVIVHVIYFNETIGTYPNLDSNQIKSQITILNNDFAGAGLNVGNTPSYFQNNVANTGIQFCPAAKDRQDQPLVPHGIDRISAAANSWQNPSTPTLNLQNYFNTVIIPATIWDPSKYLNIWVSDKPANYPMNAWATYPPGTNLTGLFNGTFGTVTNDGIWVWAQTFGDVGPSVGPGPLAPYDKGRTLTHEVGHWLGLRHIWGDGNCLSDYCYDTPTAKQAHYGCLTSTPPDQCGVGTSPNGQMTMNFMDRTDDACMYMFTNDQSIRMNTALSQSTLRYQLTNFDKCSHGAIASTSAVASFSTTTPQCLNVPFTPFNMSSGYPYPTYIWSASPSASFYPSNTVANPAVTFNNAGTYTLTLVATNSVSSSSASFVISAQNTCAATPFCMDSLRMIKNVDTLKTYRAPTNTVIAACAGTVTGNLVGTNCYKDKEVAQFFPPTTYTGSIANPQVNSVLVLFDTAGTKSAIPSTQVICKIYGGTVGNGPSASQGQVSDSLASIVASTKVKSVGYIGKPGVQPLSGTKMYPYRFDFTTPIQISSPGSGFFVALQIPTSSGDSISIMTDTKNNTAVDSSAWFLNVNNSWKTFKTNRGYKVQMAIIPVITCGPVGIKEESIDLFNANVTVIPNPSNGVFSFVFALPKEQSLSVKIFNAIGEEVETMQLKDILTNVIPVDLSNKPDGIYFTEISNGKQKIAKKIIVSH